jgi:hypothetical protein
LGLLELGIGQRAVLATKHLDDVISIGGLDRSADFADFQLEGSVLEFGDHRAFREPAQITALVFRTGVGGVLLGQFGKVTASL